VLLPTEVFTEVSLPALPHHYTLAHKREYTNNRIQNPFLLDLLLTASDKDTQIVVCPLDLLY